FDVNFIGFENYRNLLFGSERTHLLGLLRTPSLVEWLIFGASLALLLWWLIHYGLGRGYSVGGLIGRALIAIVLGATLWLVIGDFAPGGRPGSLMVTITYVV